MVSPIALAPEMITFCRYLIIDIPQEEIWEDFVNLCAHEIQSSSIDISELAGLLGQSIKENFEVITNNFAEVLGFFFIKIIS